MAMLEPISNTTGLPPSSQLQSDKIVILSSQSSDSATFSIKDEDHTLGNSLRYMVMKK
jgi:DNA-directed RNA polymerase subunit L